jgi:tetratricopeptide (TPR) repeat protein
VMSDITPANLEFYEQHHALQPFIKAKLIDFALWNMETTAPIKLKNAGLELNPETLVNPLILLANYLFDTLSHDAFHIKESQLYELQLSLKTPAANLKGEQVQNLEKIETAYDLRAIEPNYYDDPHLDAPLKLYQQELVDTSLLYPIGSMRALQRLSKLAKGKLLVLSTDKGYSTLDALDHHNHPTLSFHGSFSLMVNFHALSLFCEAQDGDAFLQSTRKGIKTSCFSLGLKLADLPQTQAALERNLEAFSPGDYFIVHRRVSDSYESCELDFLAAHLHLTRWDPHMYLKMKNRLISLVPNADRDTLAFMAQHMPTLAANYYFLPQSECILFEIGVFFHALKAYEEAIGYYELSHEFIGEQFSLWYNIGLCWYSLDEKEQAVRYFKKAKHLNSESKEVKEWLSYLGHPN